MHFIYSEKQSAESMVATMQAEQATLSKRISELEGDKKKLWRELEEEKEKAATVAGGVGTCTCLKVTPTHNIWT